MFSLSSLIAGRYLLSKKSHSVINIISWVSVVAVGIPVAGMIILLSVFNGFEGLVKGMYNDFDPDVVIEPVRGKFFSVDSLDLKAISVFDGVQSVATVLEDNAMVEYRGAQSVVVVKGVDSLYREVIPIDKMVTSGEFRPNIDFIDQALVGQGVAYTLGVNYNLFTRLQLYAPGQTNMFSSMLPSAGFTQRSIVPSGVFSLDADTDGRYIIVPLAFAQDLFSAEGKFSSVIIKGTDKLDIAKLKTLLGDNFRALSRYEQKAELYKIMTYEKWGIFFIITLVMIIASSSVVGSLIMLILDKKADCNILRTLGATKSLVKKVFIKEGMLISTLGATLGLVFGLGLCFLQQGLGLIKIPARTFMVDSYPVVVSLGDVILVCFVFFLINFVITYLTVNISFRARYNDK